MPLWLKLTSGVAVTLLLLGFAGFTAYSAKLGPLVQAQGTTFYNGEWRPEPLACKPKSVIVTAIAHVHAEFDFYTEGELQAFEQRAGHLKGLPPLNVEELYVITADDKLRDGQMVLFIGLRHGCVVTVFGFPASLYHELTHPTARG